MTDPALVLERVTKRFGDKVAVDSMDLVVPPGTVYGFLGQNGAGKTTTIRMILSIFEPTEGRITVLGHPSALDVRERIGYLPEEKGLYRKMKAWSAIAYFGGLKGLSRPEARKRANELLERYGLGDDRNKKCEALSKGMQQKVQLLASIVHDPEFVVLDEPFSGLDPVNQEVMEGVIRDLKARQRTVIFSTHVMEHAERICDRILLIAQGRKIFDGSVGDAKRAVPRRIRIDTESDPSPLQSVPGVIRIERVADSQTYEVFLTDRANPDELLAACFRGQIHLRGFDRRDPSLHEVFVTLVEGANGRAKAAAAPEVARR
ncbi:MAG TPA: ATP-binding cassette domain-containing protein [Planctomycetota bacterium]|nr:ATP-binding cassette domain-containing protein [Planctomycetota bacterium]